MLDEKLKVTIKYLQTIPQFNELVEHIVEMRMKAANTVGYATKDHVQILQGRFQQLVELEVLFTEKEAPKRDQTFNAHD